jgi:predicted nucleic acid-binding protein
MIRFIALDSSPLSLLTQRRGVPTADACKQWMSAHTANGVSVIIPEIADYELRRELLRLGRTASIDRLDRLLIHPASRYEPLTTSAIRLAAALWADTRRRGVPTADPLALDVDVILAAQVLSAGLDPAECVIATSNVKHLGQFVSARDWQSI